MERTVPSTESEEVELYTRTYNSLLRSTAEVKIRTLEEVHAGMNSLLHPSARDPQPDMSAFLYSLLRLPYCMPEVKLVILGQKAEIIASSGDSNIRVGGSLFISPAETGFLRWERDAGVLHLQPLGHRRYYPHTHRIPD